MHVSQNITSLRDVSVTKQSNIHVCHVDGIYAGHNENGWCETYARISMDPTGTVDGTIFLRNIKRRISCHAHICSAKLTKYISINVRSSQDDLVKNLTACIVSSLGDALNRP